MAVLHGGQASRKICGGEEEMRKHIQQTTQPVSPKVCCVAEEREAAPRRPSSSNNPDTSVHFLKKA